MALQTRFEFSSNPASRSPFNRERQAMQNGTQKGEGRNGRVVFVEIRDATIKESTSVFREVHMESSDVQVVYDENDRVSGFIAYP